MRSAALDRLESSRERLRAAMARPPVPESAGATGSQSWLDKLAALPMVHAVTESVRAWWSHHPVRPLSRFAGEAATAAVDPVAQRNPWVLVGGAALVGAGVAWMRPWRWIFRSAVVAGLIPQIASRLLTQLPIESWMSMLGSVLASERGFRPNSPRAVQPDARTA